MERLLKPLELESFDKLCNFQYGGSPSDLIDIYDHIQEMLKYGIKGKLAKRKLFYYQRELCRWNVK